MIVKGSQRGGAKQLGAHLLKTEENEHVEIHEISGFVADDLTGAMKEAYLRNNHPALFRDERLRKHFHGNMFHGFDFDPTMLRIGNMNMALHGVDNPDISYRDSLAQEHDSDAGRHALGLGVSGSRNAP